MLRVDWYLIANMKICCVIPNYNHTRGFADLVKSIKRTDLPVYIINDASDDDARRIMESIANANDEVTLIHHATNKGKGGAVKTGLKQALADGMTHALQIDADGQHQVDDISVFIETAKTYPDQVISGKPVYDDSIPTHRYLARYITHFWVCIETLSTSLRDTMCGFRVYPLRETVSLIERINTGDRMDFDIEILVRLYWSGVKTQYIDTRIIYPEDGLSHFRSLEDNLKISWLHTRLFFGMIPRIPQLLWSR